jgi:outer membrane receptor for ferrienterochelin and colicins
MSRALLTSTAAMALFATSPALAQAVDYAELEAMLGEPVTTSVIGKPQRASEAPAALTIISRQQIERSPARDIPGLLKVYAGLDVNRWTAGQADIAVRGSVQTYNPRLLVMVDGRQVYLDHYGMTNWNLIGVPLEQIQQIELVRGPASAIFGFNAASGVVNIITRKGDDARVDVSGTSGGNGYVRLSVAATIPLGEHVGIRLTGERTREDERAVPVYHYKPIGLLDKVAKDSINGSLSVKTGPATEIELSSGYARSRQQEYVARPSLAEPEIETATASVRVAHDLGWGILDSQIYSNWLDYRNIAVTDLPDATLLAEQRFTNRVIVSKLSVLARLSGESTIRIGGEYRTNRLDGPILYSPVVRYNVWSGDAMVDFRPSERLAVTAAGRFDRLALGQGGAPADPVVHDPALFDRHFTTFSFNGSVLAKVGAEGQLRLNGGRGYQSPSLLAFGLHVPAVLASLPLPLVISGDPRIAPAAVWSVEFGYVRAIGSHLRISGSMFYTRTDDAIALPNEAFTPSMDRTGMPIVIGTVSNIGDISSHGAEFSLQTSSGRWSSQINYSWIHTNDGALGPQQGLLYSLTAAASTPTHKVNIDVSYDAGPWFATLVGRYTSPTQQAATPVSGQVMLIDLPDTVAFDVKVAARLGDHATISVSGENLTDTRGAAGSPIWSGRRLWAGVKLTF